MSITRISVATLIALGVIAIAAAFVVAPSAHALSASDVDAICLIVGCDDDTRALLDALVDDNGGGSCPALVQPLTIGSQGDSVVDLQNYLTDTGHFTYEGGSTGYFGSITQSAVAAWQADNGVSPAAGYWGPISLDAYNSVCTSGDGGDDGDDGDDGDEGDGGDVEGGAGSVDEYEKSSEYNNEEVGEDEEDVTVVGLEIEADDNSDLEIKAVKLVFADTGGANNETDLDNYADDVSVWFDGDEYAREDADEFDDDNSYTRTLTLDDGAIVRAGERETLMVAVSGTNNLDSGNAGDDWSVDITSIRWEDGQGTVIAEDPTIAATTFSFETFATATDVAFKVLTNDRDDLNLAHIIDVSDTDATDNVEVFSFDVEIEGTSDVFLDDLTVEATVTGAAQLDEMADQAILFVDGDEVDKVTVPTDDETVTFDDLDVDLEAGNTYEFVVALDFLSTGGALDEGDTVLFTIGATELALGTAFTDIRDENGDQLGAADKTGSATSEASATHDIFINVDLVSVADPALNADGAGGNDDDSGTFQMTFDITAVGGDVYVADTAAATTAANGSIGVSSDGNGIVYHMYEDGTETVGDLSTTVVLTRGAGATDSGANEKIAEGATLTVKLTATKSNDGDPGDDGTYHMDLGAVGWSIADDDVYEYMYTYNLDNFQTDALYIN